MVVILLYTSNRKGLPSSLPISELHVIHTSKSCFYIKAVFPWMGIPVRNSAVFRPYHLFHGNEYVCDTIFVYSNNLQFIISLFSLSYLSRQPKRWTTHFLVIYISSNGDLSITEVSCSWCFSIHVDIINYWKFSILSYGLNKCLAINEWICFAQQLSFSCLQVEHMCLALSNIFVPWSISQFPMNI